MALSIMINTRPRCLFFIKICAALFLQALPSAWGLPNLFQDLNSDSIEIIFSYLDTKGVQELAVASKVTRTDLTQFGYFVDQVEIRSFEQLNEYLGFGYPKQFLNVKFHPDISREDLFRGLKSPKLIGKVDASNVVA